jgi:hypothetical protein
MYTGAVTLSGGPRVLETAGSNITLAGTLNSDGATARNLTVQMGSGTLVLGNDSADTVGTAHALGSLSITGSLDLNADLVAAASLTVSGASDLGANVTTSGAQAYSDAVTVSAASALNTTNSDVTFGASVTLGNNLTVNTGAGAGDISVTGAVDGAKALSLSAGTGAITLSDTVGQTTRLGAVTLNSAGVTTLAKAVNAASLTTSAGGTLLINGGSVDTTGAQTYGEAITLGANTTLTGSTINTQSTLNGGANALTITGAADVDGAYTNLASLTVNGAANIGANVTSSGIQTYAGAVTLSGSDRTLTGSSIHTQSTLAGGGHALTIAGAADIDGAYSGLSSLSITGASNIGANVTSSGSQTYSGAVTLSGADRTLTGTVMNTRSTLDGGGLALTVAGAADIDGDYTNLSNLRVNGTSNIGANVISTGSQTYTGAVTLSGGARTLRGTTINTQSTLAGGDNALTIAGTADIDGDYTGITNLSITGAASIAANITTSGSQIYAGGVTLSAATILTGALIHTQATLAGGGNSLTIAGAADVVGAYSGLANLSITSSSKIGANIASTGAQNYSGAVTIAANVALETFNADVSFGGLVDSASNAAFALDVRAGTGTVEFARSVGLTRPLQSLSTADLTYSGFNQAVGSTLLGGQLGSISTLSHQVFNNITMADNLDMRAVRDSGSTGVSVTTESGGTAVVYPVRISSSAGDLNFLGKVDGGGFAKTSMRSLQLNAAGQITFKDKVGFDAALNRSSSLLDNYTRHFGIYRLDVTAPIINLLGDIAAYEEIAFNGSTYVGGTAYNGTYRRVYSMDPKITFNGRVDGYGGTDGVYTLDARAISLDIRLPEPEITFAADVGSRTQLAGLVATVARLDGILPGNFSDSTGSREQQVPFGMPTTPNVGTIRFAGNVATSGLQSYLANRFVIGASSGSTALEFNSTSGDVDFVVGQGRMVSATGGAPRIKFANRPSSATISALKLSGAVITSEPNELSELVKLRETSKLSEAKLMELDLDQRAGQAPSVEVGDLISVNCTSVEEERCAPEASVQKSVKEVAVSR